MEYAANVAEKIKIGWNLGNSLDCCGLGNVEYTHAKVSEYETQWGNPITESFLFHKVSELGYGAVRIPVTWFEHMDSEGNIDGEWMCRVKMLVDMVLAEGMYCIVNVHHDTGAGEQAWLRADASIYEKVIPVFIRIWEQVAEVFKEYDEKLIFEGFNEMLDAASSWDYTGEEGFECINKYNQVFVDTVRKSGGKNSVRNLLLNTYGASPMEPAAEHFVLPEDREDGHLLVGVHFYKPDAFSAGDMEYFTEIGEREVGEFFEQMKKNFLDKGIPVILGECGTHDIRIEKERAKYAKYVIELAMKYKMAYFWWDDGDNMKILDRATGEVIYKHLQEEITQAAKRKR